MQALQEWWQDLSQRDQWIAAAVGVLIVLTAAYTFVWQPINNGHARGSTAVEKQRDLLAWMQSRAAQVTMLTARTPNATANNSPISQRLNGSAKQAGIVINRFQSASDGKVQLWLDDVKFDTLLSWLKSLVEIHGVEIDSLAISAGKQAGHVGVRMTCVTQ